uniref:transposase n=1 Tax=Orenia marismortui TaxID=46469 RepID=UPI000476B307
YNEKEVKFYYDDNKDGSNRKVMTLKVEEFIRRFLLHVPMPHLKVVRYYGIYAGCKRDELNKCRQTFGQDEVREIEKIEWQDYCEEHGKAAVCPVCGKKLVKGREFKGVELRLLLLLMGKELNSDLTLRDRERSA